MRQCRTNSVCQILEKVRLGDNALIASNVQIYTAFHSTNAVDRFGESKADGSFDFVKLERHL